MPYRDTINRYNLYKTLCEWYTNRDYDDKERALLKDVIDLVWNIL